MTGQRLAERRGLKVEYGEEPVLAWRSWALSGTGTGERLLLRPVAGRAHPWPPRQIVRATCKRHRSHDAPEVDCRCGLHASQSIAILTRTRCPAVLGRVALWGRVVEHDFGYRARFGYPQRLRLICQFCFWQHGAAVDTPHAVGWFPPDRLVPFCAEHLEIARAIGMRPWRLLEASAIEQELLGAYAVDLLGMFTTDLLAL